MSSARAAEAADYDEVVTRDLEAYSTGARVRAKDAAAELAGAVAAECGSQLSPLLARLDAQVSVSASTALQLRAVRSRLARLLLCVCGGADPGDDVSALVSAFPHVPSGWGVTTASPALSSPSASSAAAAPHAPPALDATALRALVARDVVAVLEGADARSLGLPPPAARAQLSSLIDSVTAQWAALTPTAGGGVADVVSFLGELASALAPGSEPDATALAAPAAGVKAEALGGAGLDLVGWAGREAALRA